MCALNIIVLQALYLTAEHLLGHLRSSAVTFRDLTLLDIANLCPAVLIMNFLFV